MENLNVKDHKYSEIRIALKNTDTIIKQCTEAFEKAQNGDESDFVKILNRNSSCNQPYIKFDNVIKRKFLKCKQHGDNGIIGFYYDISHTTISMIKFIEKRFVIKDNFFS